MDYFKSAIVCDYHLLHVYIWVRDVRMQLSKKKNEMKKRIICGYPVAIYLNDIETKAVDTPFGSIEYLKELDLFLLLFW